MKKYFLLTKILLKSGLGDFNNAKKRKRLVKISTKFLYAFIFLCFLPLMFSLFMVGKEGYFLLSTIGQEGIVINFVSTIGTVMTFVFGMIVVITVYYYSNDIDYLLPLPLDSFHIISAKFTMTLLYEYITVFLLLLPPLIGYGVASNASVFYWVIMVCALIFLPITPLIYSSIFSMIIMLLFKRAKNRDFLNVIMSLVVIVIVLGMNGLSSSFAGMGQQELSSLLVSGNNSLTGMMNVVFPNLALLQKALVFDRPFYLLYYIVTVAIFFIVFLLIAKGLYFKGVVGMAQTSAKRKSISKEQGERIIRRNNAVRTYTVKELKILIRTPVYFLNCVLLSIVWPVLFVIPMAGSLLSGGDNQGFAGISYAMSEMFVSRSVLSAVCLLAVFIISVFISSINFSSGTSISREGKNFYVMKYIPMDYKNQIYAKIMSGVLINILSTTVYCLIAMLVLRMPAFAIITSTIVSFLSCFIFNYLEITVDLVKPKLNWENEQSAIKHNFNTVIEMFCSILVGGGLVWLGVYIYTKFQLSIYTMGIAACVVLFILALVLHKVVLSFGEKRMRRLE